MSGLRLVKDAPAHWSDLTSELERLRELTSSVIDMPDGGPDKDSVDALAKLVGAMTKLAEFTLKAEQSVSISEVNSLVGMMSESVNIHVTDPVARRKIKQDWLRLVEGMTG